MKEEVQELFNEEIKDTYSAEKQALRCYLPRLPYDANEDEPAGEFAETGGQRGSETILVVEDDDAARAFSTETLRELGYRVLEARMRAWRLKYWTASRMCGCSSPISACPER